MTMKKRTVWLLEDEATLAEVFTEFLQPLVDVESFKSAEAALELVRSAKTPDVIISDIKLADMTGIEFLKECARYGLHRPSIIVTGFASTAQTLAAIELGVAGFIEKPFDPRQLNAMLANVLREIQLNESTTELNNCLRHELKLQQLLNSTLQERLTAADTTWESSAPRAESLYGSLQAQSDFMSQENKINHELALSRLKSREIMEEIYIALANLKAEHPRLFSSLSGPRLKSIEFAKGS